MIYKEERSPPSMPFLFYWRVKYNIGKGEDEYMCIRGVVNYFRQYNYYDGFGTPYSSPYTCLFRLYRYGRFFDILNMDTLFLPIYHNAKSLQELIDHKEEVLKDCAEIKLKIEDKYKILYGKIPNKGSPFSLQHLEEDTTGWTKDKRLKELVEEARGK